MGESGVQIQLHLHEESEASQAGLCETVSQKTNHKQKQKRKEEQKCRAHLLECR